MEYKYCVVVWVVLVVVLSTTLPNFSASPINSPPVMFNFGDSNSDTGGFAAGNGTDFVLPYGRIFFGEPSGRLCDGRLVLDFLCEHICSSYLSPYLEALGSNFRNGANFAISGAATGIALVPFTLSIQIKQFLHFKSRSLKLHTKGYKNMMTEEEFRNALYSIDIGQNDIAYAFASNLTSQQVIEMVPSLISKIEDAIKTIYGNGGRKFWIHNTGPFGCLPSSLATYNQHGSQNLDSCGCITSFNDASRAFNDGLKVLCDKLRSTMLGITIVYNDIYEIKYDIICNHNTYGFDHPLMACCGSGGLPYNFDFGKICGELGAKACSKDSNHIISWDGVHYSEAANLVVATKLLSSNYSDPRVRFETLLVGQHISDQICAW